MDGVKVFTTRTIEVEVANDCRFLLVASEDRPITVSIWRDADNFVKVPDAELFAHELVHALNLLKESKCES